MVLEKEVVIFQACTIPTLAIIAAIGGWIPYMFQNSKRFETIMGYLNTMSGGILLGVSLLHIFPEAGASLNEKCHGFPISYCVTFAGMLLMIVMLKLGHQHSHKTHNCVLEHKEDNHISNDIESPQTSRSDSVVGLQELDPKKEKRWVAAVMLLIGLFIHDVSEGFALGFTQDLMSCVFLFVAILLHKWCDVTCEVIVGIREGLTKKDNIMMMIPLVLATPAAQLIGFLICATAEGTVGENESLVLTEDFFMSFACGTFTAIAFVEIIGGEFAHASKKEVVLKALALLGGFVIIAISSIVEVVTESEEVVE